MKRAVIQISIISAFFLSSITSIFADSCEIVCNRAPVAESSFFTQINQFSSATGVLPASDPDSDPLTFTIVKQPEGGTLSDISATGDFTYTTIGKFSGTDYILFKVSDGILESEVATATIQVEYINRTPTVSNIALTAPQNVPFVFDKGLPSTDPDSDPLIFTIIFTTSHGVLSDFDKTNGNFIYTPDEGFVGTDVFTYLANDGQATSSIATGTINFVLNNTPQITILGDNPYFQVQNGVFSDPGATSTDIEDGDITASMKILSNVDTSVPGTYEVVYISSDIFEVTNTATRTVIVFSASEDIDGDGINNIVDPDIDGDSIVNNIDPDIDGDTDENSVDTDDDGDGVLDGDDTSPDGLDAYDFDSDGIPNEEDADLDGDMIINFFDTDVDGDGLANGVDDNDDNDGKLDGEDTAPRGLGTESDLDGDGIPNLEDTDIDGDTILNNSDPDIDGDGILNDTDLDIDGDGIPNTEDLDVDGDTIINFYDLDFPGIGTESDLDVDGILNVYDPDIDGDGVVNNLDNDLDGDGMNNSLDPDDDGDNIIDAEDPTPIGIDAYDFDNDGVPNEDDTDIDGDGIINFFDNDTDGDGIQNSADNDDDNDGILDRKDKTVSGRGAESDFDGDMVANSEDPDLDGDGIINTNDNDSDGDGIVNGEDRDDDNDGVSDTSDTEIVGYVLKTNNVTTGGFVVPAETYSTGKNNTGKVLGASTSCGVYLNLGKSFLARGAKNNPAKVILLKKFLNKELSLTIPLNGYFGPITENAVKQFQMKNKEKVLAPWGLDEPTGIVYITTMSVINYHECPTLGYAVPKEMLK